jgi:uncharacterized membrane protein
VTAGNVLSVAFGITDALQIVGSAATANRHSAAFCWNPVDGMHALTAPADGGKALGISHDGNRIYGWTQTRDRPRHGVLWRADGTAVAPDVDAQVDELTGGNGSATILFGIAGDNGSRKRPYRWVPGTPARNLTRADLRSVAPIRFDAGSADGAIVVGSSGSGSDSIAFVWTPAGGAQPLADFLARRSISIPSGWTLSAATAISSDGHCLGGFGLHDGGFDSFIVDLTSAASGTDASPIHPTAP